jgi:hypothetical protein
MLKHKDLEFYALLKEANESISPDKEPDSSDYDEFDEIIEEPPLEVSPTLDPSSIYDPMN